MLIAYTYPLLNILWTMLIFFGFFVYIWLLITIFSDIFRSHDLGGGAKALWVIFVFVVPFLGILIYLIARGAKMHERAAQQAQKQQQAFDDYVKDTTATGSVEQLAKLADLKEKGVITDDEIQAQKAKILG